MGDSLIRTEEREIGSFQVTCMQFSCMRAQRLRNRLMRILAPGLGELKTMALAGHVEQIMPAVGMLLAELDEDTFERFCVDMLRQTFVVSGEERVELTSVQAIERVFGADMLALDETLIFAIEVNFADFFIVLWQSLAAALVKGAAPTLSKSESTEQPPPSGQDGISGSEQTEASAT